MSNSRLMSNELDRVARCSISHHSEQWKRCFTDEASANLLNETSVEREARRSVGSAKKSWIRMDWKKKGFEFESLNGKGGKWRSISDTASSYA